MFGVENRRPVGSGVAPFRLLPTGSPSHPCRRGWPASNRNGGRFQIGMVAGFSRNGGRHHVGKGGRLASESASFEAGPTAPLRNPGPEPRHFPPRRGSPRADGAPESIARTAILSPPFGGAAQRSSCAASVRNGGLRRTHAGRHRLGGSRTPPSPSTRGYILSGSPSRARDVPRIGASDCGAR
jgi:hypothetical protein